MQKFLQMLLQYLSVSCTVMGTFMDEACSSVAVSKSTVSTMSTMSTMSTVSTVSWPRHLEVCEPLPRAQPRPSLGLEPAPVRHDGHVGVAEVVVGEHLDQSQLSVPIVSTNESSVLTSM